MQWQKIEVLASKCCFGKELGIVDFWGPLVHWRESKAKPQCPTNPSPHKLKWKCQQCTIICFLNKTPTRSWNCTSDFFSKRKFDLPAHFIWLGVEKKNVKWQFWPVCCVSAERVHPPPPHPPTLFGSVVAVCIITVVLSGSFLDCIFNMKKTWDIFFSILPSFLSLLICYDFFNFYRLSSSLSCLPLFIDCTKVVFVLKSRFCIYYSACWVCVCVCVTSVLSPSSRSDWNLNIAGCEHYQRNLNLVKTKVGLARWPFLSTFKLVEVYIQGTCMFFK